MAGLCAPRSGSLVCVILFFRVFEQAYYGDLSADHGHDGHHNAKPVAVDEAPLSMVIPLLIVAVGLILLGLFTKDIVNNLISFAIPAVIK